MTAVGEATEKLFPEFLAENLPIALPESIVLLKTSPPALLKYLLGYYQIPMPYKLSFKFLIHIVGLFRYSFFQLLQILFIYEESLLIFLQKKSDLSHCYRIT